MFGRKLLLGYGSIDLPKRNAIFQELKRGFLRSVWDSWLICYFPCCNFGKNRFAEAVACGRITLIRFLSNIYYITVETSVFTIFLTFCHDDLMKSEKIICQGDRVPEECENGCILEPLRVFFFCRETLHEKLSSGNPRASEKFIRKKRRLCRLVHSGKPT